MSNRQALRDLQSRLAARLQEAQSGTAVAWLAVRAGQQGFLFPLAQSGEIVSYVPPQAVPYVQPWFRGVVNIRGRLYGVADFAAYMGLAPTNAEPSDTSLVTFNAVLDVNCALWVDRLEGLRGADDFVSSQPTRWQDVPYMGHVLVDKQGQAWQEVDLRALSLAPNFLNISASN